MPPPRRRWFRFSLRTLFVLVTIFGVWLGVQVKWIRDRRAALQKIEWGQYTDQTGTVFSSRVIAGGQRVLESSMLQTPPALAKAPWSLRLFGENGVGSISIRKGQNEALAKELVRLFPEAIVTESISRPPATMPGASYGAERP